MGKILIADDENNILDLFERLVASMGHNAIKASNGRMAWEILQLNPDIDFLISDFAMPEMNGRDLIKKVRGSDQLKAIPIVVVSSVIRAKDIANLLEEGATHFMAKPVNLTEMKELISKHVH